MALALTIGLGFAAGVFTVLQAGLFSRLWTGSSWPVGRCPGYSLLLAALLGVILLRALLTWGSELAANAIAQRVKIDLRSAVLPAPAGAGPGLCAGERTGELASAALEGIDALDAYFSQYLPGLALAALVPLTFLVFVFPA